MSSRNPDSHALELHRSAIVIDGHSDILMQVADGKTQLGTWAHLPDPNAWQSDFFLESFPDFLSGFSKYDLFFGSAGLYSVPQWLAGGVTAQGCAIYLEDDQVNTALQRALQMTWYLHHEAEINPAFELVTSLETIHRLKREGKTGAILSFEGCEPLGADLRLLDLFYKLGLRVASLTHNRRNLFADGPQHGVKTGGLTGLGKQAIRRMNELGIVIDLVHTNEAAFWEILDLTQAPAIMSHTSPFVFSRSYDEWPPVPGFDLARDRARLEAVAKNGGVLGIIFCMQGDINKVVADIELVMETIGPDHIGLGSDLYGPLLSPKGLEDISKLPALTQRLVARGHSDETICKILAGNYLRVFAQVWK